MANIPANAHALSLTEIGSLDYWPPSKEIDFISKSGFSSRLPHTQPTTTHEDFK